MKNKIYRQVAVKERFPDKSGDYTTDKGINYFSHSRKNFTEELTQDGGITYTMEVNPKWWLEEVELPSDQDVYTAATNSTSDIFNRTEFCNGMERGFEEGANFILNHIKGGGE